MTFTLLKMLADGKKAHNIMYEIIASQSHRTTQTTIHTLTVGGNA